MYAGLGIDAHILRACKFCPVLGPQTRQRRRRSVYAISSATPDDAAHMMEWSTALRQCSAPNSQQRSEAIDQLTELLQQNDWQLPSGEGGNVFMALRERLSDSNWYAPVEPLSREARCVGVPTCDERIGCSLCAHRAGRSVKSACCSLVISWPSPMSRCIAVPIPFGARPVRAFDI